MATVILYLVLIIVLVIFSSNEESNVILQNPSPLLAIVIPLSITGLAFLRNDRQKQALVSTLLMEKNKMEINKIAFLSICINPIYKSTLDNLALNWCSNNSISAIQGSDNIGLSGFLSSIATKLNGSSVS